MPSTLKGIVPLRRLLLNNFSFRAVSSQIGQTLFLAYAPQP
jgi:hypothetical protein